MNNNISAQEAFDNATYKQAADKIRQLLSAIRNNPATSAKRWVWELLQNAKDIPNKFGKVSVEIELVSENELQFRHNGDPFVINNITGLIRQVSSKDSLNSDEETTGKFGTGFICTHLLSDIIDVCGILNYKGCRRFYLSLDRSGRSSEELMPRIKEVEKVFLEPEKHFSEVPNYEGNRHESDYDTVFRYHLTSQEKFDSAKAGLDDLVNTLPITLVTQAKKIKQVHVIDRVRGKDVIYMCNSQELDENVTFSEIQINTEKKQFLSYITSEVALTIEVQKQENGYTLIKRDSKQPVLYRDFPLIGSECFYFPYTLNGFRLCPTEKRNSIPLNGEDNEEAKDNRKIIEHAINTAVLFNEWLIKHNSTNRYLLASSRLPQPEVNYDDRIALPWIKNLQFYWRKQLLEQLLSETSDGIFSLKEISVPSFANYGDSKAKVTNETFFSLLEGYYLGRGHLPFRDHLHGWLNVLRPEYTTWEADLKYGKEDFLTDLANAKSISSLCTTLDKSREEIVTWLNSVYSFLIQQNCLSDFDEYAIIPNMEGDFKLLNELKSDYSNPIPLELMDLYNHVMTDTIQSWMIDMDIDYTLFGNTLQVFAIDNMIDWFNSKIKSNDTYIDNGTSYYANCWLAYSLIEFYPIGIQNEKYLNYRQTLFELTAVDGNQGEYKGLEVSKIELWKEADEYWFNHNYEKIEKLGTVEKVSNEYFESKKTIDETLGWINNYIKFYRDNSKGDFLRDKKIFPTQKLSLKALNDLRYDSGVAEEFKDLADYAVNTDFSSEKYRHLLLHPTITGYEQHDPLTVKEVYEFVKGVFDQSSPIIRDVIAKHAISIIVTSEDEDSSEKTLYDFAKAIFGTSIPEIHKIAPTTGFNWGFAQEFYLKKICSTISESINLDGFKALSTEFASKNNSELVEWIDSLIEFLHTFKNKKYWPIITDKEKGFGIWVNQNNNFCRFQDVRKDENIPAELKDLAASNKHIEYDFREELFTLDSVYDSYLETSVFTLTEIGEFIDNKIQSYDGDKQDKDFAALIFSVGKLCSSISGLSGIMKYYSEKKNTLIVGSLGEGETLDLVGSLIQHGDEKIRVVKEILENNSIEELNKINTILQNQLSDKRHIEDENDILKKILEEHGIDNPLPKLVEVQITTPSGSKSLLVKERQYAGLSLEEIEAYVSEAKMDVVNYFRDLNEREGLGLQFDKERIAMNSYSQLYGIYDRNGQELPLVVHSYKGPQYRYFDLNWYDWQLLRQRGSMLWVKTITGLQCIPLYALPIRNFSISIGNGLTQFDQAKLLTLAAVGKEYAYIGFEFGNNMPRNFTKHVAFDYVPDKLKDCVGSIKQICDTSAPALVQMYNLGPNIPLLDSDDEQYSLALKSIESEETMRQIHDLPANEIEAPVKGAGLESLF